MIERFRTPAMAPPPVRVAQAHAENPGGWLEAHYRRVYEERMRDMPFVNPALQVRGLEFERQQGDWLGILLTPWFLNLFLLPGGGSLWRDIPAGERCALDLPCGTMHFIADDDPDIGPYQYCPLVAPVDQLPDMATALQVAEAAWETVLLPPAPVVEEPAPEPQASRRAFLRRLGGRS